MAKFVLYHTDGCHLCEQAYSMIISLCNEDQITLCDIANDIKLVEKYQKIIPVMVDENKKELYWPFDQRKLIEFIN